MSKQPAPSSKEKRSGAREDRLKAALKANMAKRKAQSRARKASRQDGANGPEQ